MLNNTYHLIEELYKASPSFQRSINIKYDLLSDEYIDFFMPTPQAMHGMNEIATACFLNKPQRAHIFVGPYGVGKSIFAVVTAAILARQSENLPTLERFLLRIEESFPDSVKIIKQLYSLKRKILPVVLSGDEGQLNTAITRALLQSLKVFGIKDINTPTIYSAILDKISQWKESYAEVYNKFCEIVNDELKLSIDKYKEKLAQFDKESYKQFSDIHVRLSAGAEFDFTFNQSPLLFLEQVANEIKKYDYDGIVIIYDEFGRFLESRIGKPKGLEAQLLQELAEFCNRSTDPSIHFIAITHKVMTQYAQGLNEEIRVEWQRIEGRFKTLSLTGDSRVSYRLLSEALRYINGLYKSQAPEIVSKLYNISGKAIELNILDLSPNEALDAFQNCIPLHPLTTYCLPELSSKVAQYERTLYTFLFGRDENSLGFVFESSHYPWPIIYIDILYDYFNEAMKNDTAPGGTHDLWVAAEGTLNRLNHENPLVTRIVKSLAILHAVKKGFSNRPTKELLAFSVGHDERSVDFGDALQILINSKMIYFRSSTECWEFVERSELDLDEEIDRVLSSVQPDKVTLKNFMEKELKTVYYPARKYNDRFGTTRFFTGRFYTVEELLYINSNGQLNKGYIDGIVAYVLASDQEEVEEAKKIALCNTDRQIIYVVPDTYISIYQPLSELFALNILKEKMESLKEKDPKVEQEVNFLYDDNLEKIKIITSHLTDPTSNGVWYHLGRIINVTNFSSVCRYISEICELVFNKTPVVFNEALNRSEPSGQQLKAMQKLIDALLQDVLTHNLGLIGSGPEMAILKTVLKANGYLIEHDNYLEVSKPTEENHRDSWDQVEAYILSCSGEGLFVEPLINTLRLPPYGIRKGIVPLLFSIVVARFSERVSFEYQGKMINKITSKHIVDIVNCPSKYKIKLNEVNSANIKLLEVLLSTLGYDSINLQDTRHPLSKTSELLNNWLLSLSTFTKNTTRFISKETSFFRQLIVDSRYDPYKSLFHALPALVGDINNASHIISIYVNELNSADSRLLEEIKSECRKIFGDEVTEVNLLANTWLTNLYRGKSQTEPIRTSDNSTNILINFCNNADMTEFDWVRQISYDYTGLDLKYWTDSTVDRFLKMISDSKEKILNSVEEITGDRKDEIITVSIGTKENPHTFSYRKTELTPSGIKFLNTMKRSIDTTGKYLNQDERLEICMELINHVFKNIKILKDIDKF